MKQKLFRLIDSFVPENIDLALVLIQQNQSLRDACKKRYYPLMRKIDPSLGQGFSILKQVSQKLEYASDYDFLFDLITYYESLDEPNAVNNLPNDLFKKVDLPYRFAQFNIPPNARCFSALEELKLKNPYQLAQFLPVLPTALLLKQLVVNHCELPQMPPELFIFDKLTFLDLRNNGLNYVPQEITQLKNLKNLYLCHNDFQDIPETIALLKNLNLLWISNNSLKNIPDWISETSLDTLYISHNKFKEVPASLFASATLGMLNLSSNQLKTIKVYPEKYAQNLIWLEMDDNPLRKFPEDLLLLKTLKYLRLEQCRFRELPETIDKLSQLDTLNITDNQLSTFPENMGKLPGLSSIWAGGNPLTHLPESIGNLTQLKSLGLRKSKLKTVPESIQQLKNLEHLDLRYTKIKEKSPIAQKLKEWLPQCNVLVGNW